MDIVSSIPTPFTYIQMPVGYWDHPSFQELAAKIGEAKAYQYMARLWDAAGRQGSGVFYVRSLSAFACLIHPLPNWRTIKAAGKILDEMVSSGLIGSNKCATGVATGVAHFEQQVLVLCDFDERHRTILEKREREAERLRLFRASKVRKTGEISQSDGAAYSVRTDSKSKSKDKENMFTRVVPISEIPESAQPPPLANRPPSEAPRAEHTPPAETSVLHSPLETTAPPGTSPELVAFAAQFRTKPPPPDPPPQQADAEARADATAERLAARYSILVERLGKRPTWDERAALRAKERLLGGWSETALRRAMYVGTSDDVDARSCFTDPSHWQKDDFTEKYLAVANRLKTIIDRPAPMPEITHHDRAIGFQSIGEIRAMLGG